MLSIVDRFFYSHYPSIGQDAVEICRELITDEVLSHIADDIAKTISGDDTLSSKQAIPIKVVFPQPISQGQSKNVVPYVIAAILQKRLPELLNSRLKSEKPIIFTIEPDSEIKSLRKNGRGTVGDRGSESETKQSIMGRLVRQHFFQGNVDT